MSLLKIISQQLGLSSTPTNNFTLDASADNGTMKLSRGNAGATTQDILTVDASGKVAFPQGVLGATPAGAVMSFAMSTAPTGWLKADGSAVSRTTYANLFSAIGITYGTGDGSSTFNLPDLRGYFIRGADDGRGVDFGRVFGSTQADAYLNHTHTGSTSTAGSHTHNMQQVVSNSVYLGASPSTYAYWENYGNPLNMQAAGDHTHTVTINSSTSGSSETRPKNIALMFCIKT